MNKENNQNTNPAPEGNNLIGALHKSDALPSLRTYQGDVAHFIREKNESVTSIAVKEKEKRRIEEREESIRESKKGEGLKINFVAIILSLFLITAGGFAVFFVVQLLQKNEPTVTLKKEIIPYNSEYSLTNITRETFGNQLSSISKSNGITAIRLSDIAGKNINTAPLFFSFLGMNPPGTLLRSIQNEFFFGSLSKDDNINYFLIITVNDFGTAFSGMLEWETNLLKDFSFLSKKVVIEESTLSDLDQQPVSTTPVWKDLIIKNKDTRGLVSLNNTLIAYTFLDKNTILITDSLESIGDISSSFASRSVVR